MLLRVLFLPILFVRKEVLKSGYAAEARAPRQQDDNKKPLSQTKQKYLKRANHPKGWDAKLRGLRHRADARLL